MKRDGWISYTLGIGVLLVLLSFFMVSPANLWAASDTKPIKLSFALNIPLKAGPYVHAFLPWSKELEKRSNGRIKINFFPSQTLVKSRDAYNAVQSGIADLTWFAFGLNRGRFPLSGVMELPFLSPDTFTGSHALIDLYKQFPEMRAEVKDVHLLSLWVSLPYEIHTVKKPVKTLEDVKDMKLATQPGASPAVEAVGAIPVTTGVPEIYPMLEKGVADGTALAWGAFKAFKIYEVTKYHTNAHLRGVPYCIIMNKAKWDGFPKDLQAIVTEVTEKMLPDVLCQAVTDEANQGIKIARERGDEIIDLSRDQQKRWVNTAKGDWGKWAKEMDGKGLPGSAVLDAAVKLVDKYEDYGKKK